MPAEAVRLAALRDAIEAGVQARAPDAVVFPADHDQVEKMRQFMSQLVEGLDVAEALVQVADFDCGH